MKELSPFQRLVVWHLLLAALTTLLLLPNAEPFNDAPTSPQMAVYLATIFIVLVMVIRSWIEFVNDYKWNRYLKHWVVSSDTDKWVGTGRAYLTEEEWRAILDEIRVEHDDTTDVRILDEDEYDREFKRIFGDDETDPFRDDKEPPSNNKKGK